MKTKNKLKLLTGILLISIVVFEFIYIYNYHKTYIYGYTFISYIRNGGTYSWSGQLKYLIFLVLGIIQIGGAFIDGE